jgi:amino acid permease
MTRLDRRRTTAGAMVIVVVIISLLLRLRGSSGFSPPAHCRVVVARQRRRRRRAPSRHIDRPPGAAARVPKAIIDVDDIIGDDRVDPTAVFVDAGGGGGAGGGTSRAGTQGRLSATVNLCKCICGAGSFALPFVFLKEGVLGGTLAMLLCGYLAAFTMRSINESRTSVVDMTVATMTSDDGNDLDGTDLLSPPPPSSYVELADVALGGTASRAVFALTLAASLGVCSTYIVFIGQTLASLSSDSVSNNVVRMLAPDVDESTWEAMTAAIVLPLCSIRNYGVFAFTSALGVIAVLGGMTTTLAYGTFVDPGGGIVEALSAASRMRMWPISPRDAFGGSFGTIAYLFCVNFLTFPIINSMKDPEKDYDGAVSTAVAVIWIVNVVFAVLCLGFYGDDTQDLILRNLGNGPYLSALKLLLCVDLLFTFPVVFSSGRQILENALVPNGNLKNAVDDGEGTPSVAFSRAAITTGAVATCLGLSQLGGFGTVANLVGGVAQGTLAFVLPPAISIALSRRQRNDAGFDIDEIPQWLVGGFGIAVVVSVMYSTLTESLG